MYEQIVKADAKGRIVLPGNFRKKYKNKKLVVTESYGVIHIVPKGSIKELRGIAPGFKAEGYRDEQDRYS